MTIYQKILQLCKEKGTTKTEVEKVCGFSQNSLLKWEQSSPTIERVAKVADYFGVTIDYLVGRETRKQEPTTAATTKPQSAEQSVQIRQIAVPYKIYTSRQLIAFVDIIGTVEMSGINDLLFSNILKEVYDNFQVLLKKNGKCSNIQFKCFSDNIAFSCKYQEENAISEISNMIDLLSAYQIDLLRHGILCRGCLTLGDVYIDNTFVIGNGLIDAYLMEKTKAIYPRIIVSDNIITIIKQHYKNENTEKLIIEDFDGNYFINFASLMRKTDYVKLNTIIKPALQTHHEKHIIEKYVWLQNYIRSAILETHQSFPDFYEENKTEIQKLIKDDISQPTAVAERTTTALSDKFASEYQHLFTDKDFVKVAKVYDNANATIKGILVGFFIATARANGVDTLTLVGY